MRLVCSGDWQCSLTNLDRCRIFVAQLVRVLKEDEQTFFLHLGDIKEHWNPIDVRVTNYIIEALTEIRQSCRGFYYIRGNHDSITTQDGVPNIVPLIEATGALALADTSWVRIALRLLTWNPEVVRYALLYLVPFMRDPARQLRAFREAAADAAKPEYRDPTCDAVGRNNIHILAFHNSVRGFRESLHTTASGLSADEIGAANYDICIGGHIHVPQHVGNIYFAGSPFPMDWGEVNYQHRFLTVSISEERKRVK